MASYQRVALYLIFDSMEQDLVSLAKEHIMPSSEKILTNDEISKSLGRLRKRNRDNLYDTNDHFDLLYGLDIGDKFDVLIRHAKLFPQDITTHLKRQKRDFEKAIPIRNDTMHGRTLTDLEQSEAGFQRPVIDMIGFFGLRLEILWICGATLFR